MDNYLDWKFQTYKKALYITLFIFFTVHLTISLIFCIDGIRLAKFIALCLSYFFVILFWISKTNNNKLVWTVVNISIFIINLLSLINDQNSPNFQAISGTSISTILTGVTLLSWFFPVNVYPIQIAATFFSYIMIARFYGHSNPFFSYAMVFPVGIGTIAFVYIYDNFSKKLFESQTINKKMAVTDSLTSTFNRQYIKNNITIDEKMKFSGHALMLDIDHFKKINDTFGHHIGDLALCFFVKIINENIRKEDILIRFGGEEFLIFLKDSSLEIAKDVAERIRVATENSNFDPKFTCSIGIDCFQKNERFENLTKKIDKKLYKAKRTGRNKVC